MFRFLETKESGFILINDCLHQVARASFVARNEDELSFHPGDEIRVLQQPDGGWWEGVFSGTVGWFPSNHVAASDLKQNRLHNSSGKVTSSLKQPSGLLLALFFCSSHF
jgi:hypothetical protein